MNPAKGRHNQFIERLRRLLKEAESGGLDLSTVQVLFLVGLDNPTPQEAETWLREALGPRGRILAGGAPGPGNPSPALSRPRIRTAGVSPEEKSILWGK